MRYRQMGRTGLFVSEICLGTMTFGGEGPRWKLIGGLDQQAVDLMIGRALSAGVNFIDTADIYAHGQSERLLGHALRNLGVRRGDVVIASKAYVPMSGAPNDRGASRGHLMDSVAASLERLQTDHIDLYQIHGDDAITPVDETLRAMDDLVSQGLVRYVGVSNWAAWKIAKALGVSACKGYARVETLQAYYSIAGRDLEREFLAMLNEERLGLMVWAPLAGGLLSGKFGPGLTPPDDARRSHFDSPPVDKARAWACIEVMRAVAQAHGVSVAQVALGWLLAKPHVMSVIVGAKTIRQLDDNLDAANLALTAEQMTQLDAVSALPVEYPGWMIAQQGADRAPQPFTGPA